MKLLLTGFEPFGGSSVNPSEQVVRALADQTFEGIALRTAVLPVDRVRGPAELIGAVQHCQPEAVICLGEAARRAAISIERVAINLLDYRIADNSGNQTRDESIVPGGPAAFFATLPVRKLADAIRGVGVPVELSLSAGTFLCNQVMYELLHYLALNKLNVPAGFVHLPPLPEQVVGNLIPSPSMSLETTLRGISAAICAISENLSTKDTKGH